MFGRTLTRLAIVSAGLAIMAGCGGVTGVDDTQVIVVTPPTTTPGDSANRIPATLSIVSGDGQATLVNQIAGERLVVRVVDALQRPVKNVAVKWTAVGGVVTPLGPTTNDDGEASATWQFDHAPGVQFVRAEAGSFSATFQGTATLQYTSIDAGGFHSCAITPSAAVYCWGYNGDGQLGIGSQDNRNVSTPASSSLTFRQLSGGRYHTCGITLAGVAYCWGQNVDGRLGTGDYTPSAEPVQVGTPVAFQEVGSGWNHSCGLSKAGLAYCWGFNQEGEVGAPIFPDSVTVTYPRPVSGQSFKKLGVGGLHSCAVAFDETVWCWGLNNFGQLGDGTTRWTLNNLVDSTGKPLSSMPVPVQSALRFQSVVAGAYHSCGLSGGAAYCWGDNRQGQLGNGSTTNSLTPVPVVMPSGASFASISAGDTYTCAVSTTGQAYCWGDNQFGQFGDGTTTASLTPVTVASGLTFASFSAGETLSCGVTTIGRVYCMGNNLYGQLGDATNVNRPTPVKGAYQP